MVQVANSFLGDTFTATNELEFNLMSEVRMP